MIYGYARVSTRDQNPALQLDALAAAGCDEVLEEVGSGAKTMSARPVLAGLLAHLRSGDQVVVWKLDRFGRSAREVILAVDDLRSRGIAVRSLTEGLDTSTPIGAAMAGIMAVLAQLERETILERVRAGIEVSRREGRHGRPRTWDPAQVRHAHSLIDGGASVRQAARLVGLPRSTLVDALGRMATHPAPAAPIAPPG